MMRSRRLILALLACMLPNTVMAARATATPPKHRSASAIKPRLSADSARVIASAKVPGGRVKSHELEREHGHLIYSFDFVVPGKPGIDEVNVDAMSGEVLAVEHEGPKIEQRERTQEKREAKKPTTPR